MKRFYQNVSMKSVAGGYGVFLDGRPIKTPSKMEFVVPNASLCELVCAEWEEQEDKIRPNTMPLTQLVHTKIEKVSKERTAMEEQLLKYIHSDLLCYRTDKPEELVERQNRIWQPHLEWFAKTYGHAFKTTDGLTALRQDEALCAAIAKDVSALDDERFTLFQMITPAAGSIVLALAFIKGAITADDVMAAAFLEEDYKFDLYNEAVHGGDPLTEKKRTTMRRDIDAAQDYLDTL